MSIIYTVIAREEVMLVQYTQFSGNFVLTAKQVLKLCSPARKYVKYAANNYIFYVLYQQFAYVVMCDASYSERIAFSYLEKIKKLFTSTVDQDKAQRGNMYSCMEFSEALKSNTELYNTPEQVDNVAKLWKETEQVNQIINQDLQRLIERGQKIEVLVNKTNTMSALSLDMREASKTIKNEMFWKNWKFKMLIIVLAFVLVYFILAIFCGGLALKGCF